MTEGNKVPDLEEEEPIQNKKVNRLYFNVTLYQKKKLENNLF